MVGALSILRTASSFTRTFVALGNLPPTAAKRLLKKKNYTKFIGYHIRFSSTVLGKPKSGASFRKLEVVPRH